MWGSVHRKAQHNGLGQARIRRSARRHTDNGRCLAALRAVTAAQLYMRGDVPTLDRAAKACGSNVHYVQAALVLLKSEDQALLSFVLQGFQPLLAAAARKRQVVKLVQAYRTASSADLKELGHVVGPADIWDRVIAPAL